jgi:hypothetical protein
LVVRSGFLRRAERAAPIKNDLSVAVLVVDADENEMLPSGV